MNPAKALVIGDLSMVRALGRLHIPVTLATSDASAPAARSRFCQEVLTTPSFVDDPSGAVDAVVAWSRVQSTRPVLFYQGDHDLLALSRERARVSRHAHLVMPRSQLVEALVDKLRFAELAVRARLPVPRTQTLRRDDDVDAIVRAWDAFPCVLKPSLRSRTFAAPPEHDVVGARPGKAIRIESKSELERVAPLVLVSDGDCVLQAAVDGGEDRILSYHAYVRDDGSIAAELTGKKIRTTPRRYGFSTCVAVRGEPDVVELGHEVVKALAFTGVVKMDFKRDARDERLYLLEINPRFNMWHHAATIAGVPIPALVYESCVHRVRSDVTVRPRRDVVWMNTGSDALAAIEHVRAGDLSVRQWFVDLARADIREDLCIDDPLPGVIDFVRRAASAIGRRFA